MTRKRTVVGFSLVALSATLLLAQWSGTPPTPAQQAAHEVARLTKELTLTSAQQSQATTIFTNQDTALASVRSSLGTARKALETAVEANDSASIASTAAQIGTLTTQEVQTTASANAAFYAILTAEQQTIYKALPHGGFGFGRGPGPGGPPPQE
jgi:Spy/CpxP family protein refolding chaperone